MQFTRRPDESAVQMRSRMENLLEALPGILAYNEAALKYLSQFSFQEKRQIQQHLISRHGNTGFTFRQAAQEAAFQELNYAIMDSRDPQYRRPKSDPAFFDPNPMPASPRQPSRGPLGPQPARRPRQAAAAMQPGPPTAAPPHRAPTAPSTAATGPRCHRCGDPSHLANACHHVDLQCGHCQSKGLPGRGHMDRTCFALHPELILSYRRPRNPVGHVAPTFAVAPTVAAPAPPEPDIDARIETALSAALSRIQTQNSDFAFVGCTLVNTAATAPRPVRSRQLPARFRQPLPPAADHNRAGRPDVSRLPLGHRRSAPIPPDLPDLGPPASEESDVLTLLDSS